VYVTSDYFGPKAMDSKAIHLWQACAVVIWMVDTETIQWQMESLFAIEDGLMESTVMIVICSSVRTLVSLVYNVVFVERPNSGHTLIRDILSGVRRIEKKSDPSSRPITLTSQFLMSFGSYVGIMKVGVDLIFLMRVIIADKLVRSTTSGTRGSGKDGGASMIMLDLDFTLELRGVGGVGSNFRGLSGS